MKQWVRRLGYATDLITPDSLGTIARDYPQFRALISSPYYLDLIDLCPRLGRQYLSSYLMRSFTPRERLRSALHHYSALRDLLRPTFVPGMLGDGVEIWARELDGDAYHMVIKQNRLHFYEGDLLLCLYRNGQLLFQISFAIVDAQVVGMAEGNVLLLGSAQGGRADSEELRTAVKANSGVAPSHLVMAALRGVAHALSVPAMAAVSNADQIIKTSTKSEPFPFDYDAFWPMFGGELNARGVFVIPTEAWEKPLSEIQRSHRRRSRKKREYKAEVTADVANALGCFRRIAMAPVVAKKQSRLKTLAAATAPVLLIAGDAPLPF